MDRTRVGDQERPAEALAPQLKRSFETRRRLSAPVGPERPAGGGGERIEPERDCAFFRFRARAFDQGAKAKRLARAIGPKIEFEMRPFIETHALKSLVKRGRIESPEAETISAGRASEYDLETVRAVGEVVERLGVGLAGVGMIEPRHNPPGAFRPKRPLAFRRAIDRFDPDAVRGLRYERFQARAPERGFRGFAPVGLGIGGKKACDCAHRLRR